MSPIFDLIPQFLVEASLGTLKPDFAETTVKCWYVPPGITIVETVGIVCDLAKADKWSAKSTMANIIGFEIQGVVMNVRGIRSSDVSVTISAVLAFSSGGQDHLGIDLRCHLVGSLPPTLEFNVHSSTALADLLFAVNVKCYLSKVAVPLTKASTLASLTTSSFGFILTQQSMAVNRYDLSNIFASKGPLDEWKKYIPWIKAPLRPSFGIWVDNPLRNSDPTVSASVNFEIAVQKPTNQPGDLVSGLAAELWLAYEKTSASDDQFSGEFDYGMSSGTDFIHPGKAAGMTPGQYITRDVPNLPGNWVLAKVGATVIRSKSISLWGLSAAEDTNARLSVDVEEIYITTAALGVDLDVQKAPADNNKKTYSAVVTGMCGGLDTITTATDATHAFSTLSSDTKPIGFEKVTDPSAAAKNGLYFHVNFTSDHSSCILLGHLSGIGDALLDLFKQPFTVALTIPAKRNGVKILGTYDKKIDLDVVKILVQNRVIKIEIETTSDDVRFSISAGFVLFGKPGFELALAYRPNDHVINGTVIYQPEDEFLGIKHIKVDVAYNVSNQTIDIKKLPIIRDFAKALVLLEDIIQAANAAKNGACGPLVGMVFKNTFSTRFHFSLNNWRRQQNGGFLVDTDWRFDVFLGNENFPKLKVCTVPILRVQNWWFGPSLVATLLCKGVRTKSRNLVNKGVEQAAEQAAEEAAAAETAATGAGSAAVASAATAGAAVGGSLEAVLRVLVVAAGTLTATDKMIGSVSAPSSVRQKFKFKPEDLPFDQLQRIKEAEQKARDAM
ncbi:uncharacterized protein LY79DRAFT_674421 [Colletotrichum navitas]|uniref:Uncharacterized protein n=1 Tax=Colletotrichum navitas TaxID=681940 RepID=A0AAD8UY58_9PEZI|nr:uncharacterized protein LY79DRAFT_674421 [Colletotrichum navitas]KAK1569821.1 hypothetical protein LY79DRAFT_674421 [Colletotrichum navitas]